MNSSNIAKILKRSGQPITLTRTGQEIYDPSTGSMSGGIIETHIIYGITTNYKQSDIAGANSLILSGDKKAIIDSTVKPIIGDSLVIRGDNWLIISFNEVSPQGDILLYNCQIRR